MMRHVINHSRGKALLISMFAVVICAVPVVLSASTIPWNDGFDGYSNEDPLAATNGWSASSTNVMVQNTNYYGGSGLAAHIPVAEAATNIFTKNTSQTNVWMDMRVKVTTSETPPEFPSSISCAFFFHTNGCPVVQNGSQTNWQTNTMTMTAQAVPTASVTAGSWVRITVYKDYLRKKWALFVDDTLIRDDYDFYKATVNGLSGFSIQNNTFVDEFSITTNRPLEVSGAHTNLLSDIDGDGTADAWEIDYFGGIALYSGGSDPDDDGRINSEEYIAGSDPTVPDNTPQAIPYREDFDSSPTGAIAAAWHGIMSSGTVEIVSSDYIDANNALSISNGGINLVVADETASNVWLQFYTKIVPYDDGSSAPTVSENDQAAFYVNTNLDLMAFSGSTWLKVRTNSIPTNTWVGFATHLDYTAEKWDLFVSTNGGYNVRMERVNGDPMDFATTNTASSGLFTNFSVVCAASVLLDAIAVSPAYTNTSVTHTNAQGYDRFSAPGAVTMRPPYDYEGTNATLQAGAALGEDLKRGLSAGDSVQIHYTNGWNMYYLDGDLNWQKQYGMDIDVMQQITPSAPLTMTASENMTVFYTYGVIPTNAGSIVILGTNSFNEGWNYLEVNFDEQRTLNHATLGFNLDDAAAGDRIYPNGNRYIYNSTLGQWKSSSGGVTTNENLGPGPVGFWYYRKSITDMVWVLP